MAALQMMAFVLLALVPSFLLGAEALVQVRGPSLCLGLPWSVPTNLDIYVVPVGTTCSWLLKQDAPICIKSTANPPVFDSGLIQGFNNEYRFTFNKLGRYPYSGCIKTPKLKGVILVVPATCKFPKPPTLPRAHCRGKCYGQDKCALSCAKYPKTNKSVACNKCCRKGNKRPGKIAKCLKACNR